MSNKNVPLESSITVAILRYLRKLPRCRVSKRHGGRLRGGEPDIFGSLQGRHIELEVKRPSGKLTQRQFASLEKWERAGAIVAVVYSVDDVKELLRAEGFAIP